MLDWLGAIFSGISIVLQYKEKSKYNEVQNKIISLVKTCSDKLLVCKSVHGCFQEFIGHEFAPFLETIKSQNDFSLIKSDWDTRFSAFNRLYNNHYRLDIRLDMKDTASSAKYSLDDAVRLLGKSAGEFVEILNKSYPTMIEESFGVRNLINEYNDSITKGDLMKTIIHELKELLPKVIEEADKSLRALVDLNFCITELI